MSKLSTREQKTEYAAIAQSVERILGKDEVASSNLASSSKRSTDVLVTLVLFLIIGGKL